MFNPITVTFIKEQLNNIDWVDRIYRLDSAYGFKFNISKLISSPISQLFYSFARSCLQLVVMKTYCYLLEPREMEDWRQEMYQITAKVERQYCALINLIKRKKKIYVMDIMIFVIALLSREFIGNIFEKTNKKTIITDKRTVRNCKQNNLSKGMLLIEQYTFIIVTYQTTGNIVSPHSFEVLKKKLSEHQNPPSRHQSVELIVESLRHIRNQYQKKMTYLKTMKSQAFIEESIESALKILDNLDYYEQKLQKKSNMREDKISIQLCQILEKGLEQKNHAESQPHTKLQKISEASLSKAAKINYNIVEKDLSLLRRTKRTSQYMLKRKKPRQNYWKQIKHTNKPVFHIKNRTNQHSPQQSKEQEKNWIQILNELKTKFKKPEVQIQKFKSLSATKFEPTKQRKTCVENISQKQQSFPRISNSVHCLDHGGQSNDERMSVPDMRDKIQAKGRIFTESYKFHKVDDQTSEIKKPVDITKLKKKVLNLKNQRKIFEQRCKERKIFIESCHQS